MSPALLLTACALDAVIGDPRWLPHPVRVLGIVIGHLDRLSRAVASPALRRGIGVILALGLPALTYVGSLLLIDAAARLHPALGAGLELVLAATALAARDLHDHVLAVRHALQVSLEAARQAVSRIVGRDTNRLEEPEIVRATVETVAESASDGVIAPLLYLALGGVPLALAYKAINTLDSMIGHRTPPYRELGWASARLDDLVNWLPARVTAALLVGAGGLQTRSVRRVRSAVEVLRRDGGKHPSPNSGRPEAAMAGVLQVRLGGTNVYDGEPDRRPYLGEPQRPLRPELIAEALRLMWGAYLLALVPALLLAGYLGGHR